MKAAAPFRRPRRLATAAFAAALAGCATLGTVAPPVSPAMLAVSRGTAAETLETGRSLLTTRCAACHRVYPIAAYTPPEWHGIVGDMAHRTKLTAAQQAAVVAYLTAAHAALPPRDP